MLTKSTPNRWTVRWLRNSFEKSVSLLVWALKKNLAESYINLKTTRTMCSTSGRDIMCSRMNLLMSSPVSIFWWNKPQKLMSLMILEMRLFTKTLTNLSKHANYLTFYEMLNRIVFDCLVCAMKEHPLCFRHIFTWNFWHFLHRVDNVQKIFTQVTSNWTNLSSLQYHNVSFD